MCHFNPPIQVEDNWMLRLIDLEVYKAIFIITGENNVFELYTDFLQSGVSITELKDKVAEALGLSDITHEELEHEIYGLDIIQTYRKLVTEKSKIDGY